MNDVLKLRKGKKMDLPTLDVGEPALTLDAGEEALYIGTLEGNKQIGKVYDFYDFTCEYTRRTLEGSTQKQRTVSTYSGFKGDLTGAGRDLLAKKVPITFTKLRMGDGEGIFEDVRIRSITKKDDKAILEAVLETSSVKQGFFWRECGLYAMDPDQGEILYNYAYSTKPDFIAASDSGMMEEIIVSMIATVGSNTNVDVTIDDSMVLATKKEFNDLKAKVKETFVTVESFGAKGDGISDDTQAFKDAVLYASENNCYIKLSNKTYLITTSIEVVSMLGEDSVIELQNRSTLQINNLNDIFVRNITFKSDALSGIDDVNVEHILTLNSNTKISSVELINLKCIPINQVSQKRIASFINIFVASDYTKIDCVFTTSVGTSISLPPDSKNIYISNIIGEDAQTLIYGRSGTKNIVIKNAKINNTFEHTNYWIGKNAGLKEACQGMDVVLIEDNVSDVLLEDIHGIYCLERNIYCRASNVIARNISSYNTGGHKFVGDRANNKYITNILVENATQVIDDERMLTRGVGTQFTQIYQVDGIQFKNCSFDNKTTSSISQIVPMNDCMNIIFDGFTTKNNKSAYPVFLYISGILKNIKIQNAIIYNPSIDTSGACLFGLYNGNTPTSDVYKNVFIENCKCYSDIDSSPRRLIDVGVAENFTIKNCELNGKRNNLCVTGTQQSDGALQEGVVYYETYVDNKLQQLASYYDTKYFYKGTYVQKFKCNNQDNKKLHEGTHFVESNGGKYMQSITGLEYKYQGFDKAHLTNEIPVDLTNGTFLVEVKSTKGYALFSVENGVETVINSYGEIVIANKNDTTDKLNVWVQDNVSLGIKYLSIKKFDKFVELTIKKC